MRLVCRRITGSGSSGSAVGLVCVVAGSGLMGGEVVGVRQPGVFGG
ncbi:hypothetical protein [Actinoplanes couchii]|nr:hypothetical protein [Actinoplanes couchii]MDR6321591.1 hypothetical protein [Actinoplanes couchii]